VANQISVKNFENIGIGFKKYRSRVKTCVIQFLTCTCSPGT